MNRATWLCTIQEDNASDLNYHRDQLRVLLLGLKREVTSGFDGERERMNLPRAAVNSLTEVVVPFTTGSRSIFGNRCRISRGVRGHWDRFFDNF